MLQYRKATLNDLSQLRKLEQCVVEAERPFNTLIKSDATYYNLEQLLSGNESYVLVAEASQTSIATGYAQIRTSKDSLKHDYHSYLGFMFVAPEYRGQGINQQIITQLIDWSKDKGINDIYLEVYAENLGAIKAYEKAGFKPSTLEMKLST